MRREVQFYDDDELESLRDGDSVVTEFDSVVFVPEIDARATRGGSAEVRAALRSFGRCGFGHNHLDPSVRHAEHSSFLLEVPNLLAVQKLLRKAVPTILPDKQEGGLSGSER